MDQSLVTIQQLLLEVSEHLKSSAKPDTTAAAAKLHRIAAVASTLAFTISSARR